MKTWNRAKMWAGGLMAVVGIAALSTIQFSGADAAAPAPVTSKGDADVPGAKPRVAGIAEKALWKPEPFVAPGFAGTGATVATSEAAGAELISEEALAKLPTIEKLLGMEEPETVCGSDTRTQVGAVTTFPWRAHCHLVITLQNGQTGTGTGWMSGRGTVMTAGHCVHTGGTSGQWVKSIIVIPGRNGVNRPYGSIAGAGFRSVTGWTRDASPEYDYGCILLPSNNKIGDRTGYYGFAAFSDSLLNNLLVNTAGYPGDKPSGTQWRTNGNLSSVAVRRLFYNMDTFGGQSGSVVYRYRSEYNERIAVGIHCYGGCPNGATRITTGVFNNMVAWRNLTK
jgi:glutamyl endopeptidase